MCFGRLVVGVASDMRHRNGSESRETMPLRKGSAIGCASEGLWSGLPRMRDTATAVNPGKRCRCGRGRQSRCASEGLWSGSPRICDTTTAVNPGKRCRCGKGRQSGCASEGLWSGSPRMRDTATAVNPGKWCRCGKGASVGMCFRRLVFGVASDMRYRNGSEFRELLPLRYG